MKELDQSAYLYDEIKDSYLKQRVMNSLNWYIKMAVLYKRCYYTFYSISIIAPLVVTVLNSLDSEFYLDNNLKLFSAILATITTIASSLLALYRFKDKWQAYRSTCELIKTELMKYHMKIGQHINQDPKTLCDAVEAIIADNSNKLVQIVNSADEEKKKGKTV